MLVRMSQKSLTKDMRRKHLSRTSKKEHANLKTCAIDMPVFILTKRRGCSFPCFLVAQLVSSFFLRGHLSVF